MEGSYHTGRACPGLEGSPVAVSARDGVDRTDTCSRHTHNNGCRKAQTKTPRVVAPPRLYNAPIHFSPKSTAPCATMCVLSNYVSRVRGVDTYATLDPTQWIRGSTHSYTLECCASRTALVDLRPGHAAIHAHSYLWAAAAAPRGTRSRPLRSSWPGSHAPACRRRYPAQRGDKGTPP